MGLVRSLQSWDILLIYCNNQVKKYIAPLLRLASRALSTHFWCLCQKLSLSLFTLIKLLPHKSPEWSSLVSGPEAKSSEIMNPTPFHHKLATRSLIFPILWFSSIYLHYYLSLLFSGTLNSVGCIFPFLSWLPGSSVHGISQARTLEWVVISFPRGSSWPRDQIPGSCHISCIADGFFTIEPPGKLSS